MNYYVHTEGNNANPGTVDKPFLTIGRAIQMASNGDTVYISGGTYREHVVVSKQLSIIGDPLSTVTIDGRGEYPLGAKGFFSALVQVEADSVTLADLVIKDSAACGISLSGYDDITIDNVIVENPSRNGILISAADIVSITDSEIWGARTKVDLTRSDRRGAALEIRDSTNVALYFNEVHDNDWQGIGIVECQAASIEDNVVYDNLGTQLYIDGLDTGDITRNQIFYTTKVRTVSRAAGIHIARDIYPLGSGASASTAVPNRNIDIQLNLIVGCSNPIIHRGGFATVYDRDSQGNVTERIEDIPDYKWDDIVISQNTMLKSSKPLIIEKERDLFVFGRSGDIQCLLSDNIIHTTGTTTLQWREEDIGTYQMAGNLHSSTPTNLKRLKELSGCTGIQIGDPVLVNMDVVINSRSDWDVENYKVRQASPARDKGYAYSYVAEDYFGTSIPALGPYPVGFHAYESSLDDIIVADFSIDDASGNVPHEVQFTDKSSGTNQIVKWSWSFGDGSISTERSPRHVYTRAGLFTVTLTVMDNKGQTDRKVVSNAITVSFGGVTPTSSNRTRIESSFVELTKTVGVNATQAHNMTYKPDVLIIKMAFAGTNGGITSGTLAWAVLTSDGAETDLGFSYNLQAYDEGGAVAAAQSKLHNKLEWADVYGGLNRSLTVTWDEDYIYVADGSNPPTYNVDMSIMAIGGPDMDKSLHEVTTTPTSVGSYYNSGDIGFQPDVLLAWGPKGKVTTGDPDVLAGELHIGILSKDYGAASYGNGTPYLLNTSWTQSQGRYRDDRLLSLTSIYDIQGAVGGEITANGFNIFTDEPNAHDLHVLAMKFGDLRHYITSPTTPAIASGQPNQTVNFVIGWKPQFVFGITSYFADLTGYIGASSNATGLYFNDGVSQRTTNLAVSNTNYADIVRWREQLLGCISQTSLSSLMWRADLNIVSNGFTVEYLPGGFGVIGNKKYTLLAIEDGTTDPITAGFSVNKLTAFTDSTIRVTNRTYSGDIGDLQYSYTWTGGGSSSLENPTITFTTPGTKTITQTVTSASNSNITDTYQVVVLVIDNYIVPKLDIDFGDSYNVEATVGVQVSFNDLTIPPSGTAIESRSWVLSIVDENNVSTTVAQADGPFFSHVPAEQGKYVVSLHVVLDDGRTGTVRHEFVADVSLAPVVRINTYEVAATTEEMSQEEVFALTRKYPRMSGGFGSKRYPQPATLRFKDTSDTGGREVFLRQWIIAPCTAYGILNIPRLMEYSDVPMAYITGGYWSFTGREEIDFTFDKEGEYFVTLIVQTSGGVGYYSRPVGIVVGEKRHDLIGPPGPALVGPQSRSIIDGWGNHSHALDTTVSGEPSKVVVTDSHGGIHAKYFKVTGSGEALPAMQVEGALDIAGDKPEITGERIALSANSLVPGTTEVQLGEKGARFSSLHAGQVDAGQLAQVGDVNAVGGSIFVGRSYGLAESISPEDVQIIIYDGGTLMSGDYLYFSRENTVEVMRVEADPVTERTDRDTWRVSVSRGSEVGAGYVASPWNAGDVALNLGGSTDDEGVIVPTSWLEILADESIRSRLVDPGLAEGPVMAGAYRYGTGPTDWINYIGIGRLDGMYGIPEGVHKVGVAFGKDSSGSAFFQVDEDGVTFNVSGSGTYIKFGDDGLTIYAAMVNETTPHASAITDHAIKFRHPETEALTASIQQTFDTNLMKSLLKISAPPPTAGWTSGVMLRAYAPNGDVAAISVMADATDGATVKLTNIPSSDPEVDGALYYDTSIDGDRVIKISTG